MKKAIASKSQPTASIKKLKAKDPTLTLSGSDFEYTREIMNSLTPERALVAYEMTTLEATIYTKLYYRLPIFSKDNEVKAFNSKWLDPEKIEEFKIYFRNKTCFSEEPSQLFQGEVTNTMKMSSDLSDTKGDCAILMLDAMMFGRQRAATDVFLRLNFTIQLAFLEIVAKISSWDQNTKFSVMMQCIISISNLGKLLEVDMSKITLDANVLFNLILRPRLLTAYEMNAIFQKLKSLKPAPPCTSGLDPSECLSFLIIIADSEVLRTMLINDAFVTVEDLITSIETQINSEKRKV